MLQKVAFFARVSFIILQSSTLFNILCPNYSSNEPSSARRQYQRSLTPFPDHLALPSDALGPQHASNELEMSPLIPKDSVITLDYVSARTVSFLNLELVRLA